MTSKPKCDLTLPRRKGERRIIEVPSGFALPGETTYQLKKLANGTYFLARYHGEGRPPARSRFGDAKQIRQDLKQLCSTGALPRGGVY